MRRINFAEPNDPEWNDWRERCEKARNTLIQAIEAGQNPVIERDLYKEQKVRVYMDYDQPFHGKCAYCDRDLHNQPGDIDHYRPASSVTEADRQLVTRMNGDQSEKHPGYYWLVYDWRNLLPACERCNRPSKQFTEGRLIGKWDRFPIRGRRAWHHDDDLSAEDPLLINPVEVHPLNHLIFDKNGVIRWKTDYGETTVKILGLNDYGLPDRRREKYEQVKALTNEWITNYRINRQGAKTIELFDHINRIIDGYGEFTICAVMAIKDARQEHQYPLDEIFCVLSRTDK